MPTGSRSYDDPLGGERNRLVILVIAVVALGIINSLAFRFPNAWKHLTGLFLCGDIIRVATFAIMLILVVGARRPLAKVFRHLSRRSFKVYQDPELTSTAPNINQLSVGLANIAVTAASWPITVKLIGELLLIEPTGSLHWFTTLVSVAFALLLVFSIYIAFQPVPGLLSTLCKHPSRALCSRCGASNSTTAQFCRSCGAKLQSTQTKSPPSIHCPSCGTENRRGNRFCEHCGTTLTSDEADIPRQ